MFPVCFNRFNASLYYTKDSLILTLLTQQYTLLTQLAFAWRRLVVENPCLYEMAAVFSVMLFDIKGYVCTKKVHLWIEATPAT